MTEGSGLLPGRQKPVPCLKPSGSTFAHLTVTDCVGTLVLAEVVNEITTRAMCVLPGDGWTQCCDLLSPGTIGPFSREE